MLERFVITEFFREPDEDCGNVKTWYHTTNGLIKREIKYVYDGFFIDVFYDINEEPHMDYGQPAMFHSGGFYRYYFHGKLHRGHFEPAVIHPDGRKEYWVYGEKRSETLALTKNNVPHRI